ncbi:MAG TPA: RNA polymerase sigma-70 factor [Bacteroidales bacterium]|nr:RNA polymerase sigma-70 factor [Bacteroidales bacterium]
MTVQTDTEYLQRIIKGDKVAFDMIFLKYYSILLNYACKILKDTLQAEDIVQDVFFQLWIKQQQLISVKSLSPYLHTAVHNLCISQIRKQSKNDSKEIDLNPLVEFEILYKEIIQYHEDSAISNDLKKALDKAINSLPGKCRVVFILSRNFGFRNTEIAEFLEISVKAVEKHITRALSQLRFGLIEYLPLGFVFFLLHQ